MFKSFGLEEKLGFCSVDFIYGYSYSILSGLQKNALLTIQRS